MQARLPLVWNWICIFKLRRRQNFVLCTFCFSSSLVHSSTTHFYSKKNPPKIMKHPWSQIKNNSLNTTKRLPSSNGCKESKIVERGLKKLSFVPSDAQNKRLCWTPLYCDANFNSDGMFHLCLNICMRDGSSAGLNMQFWFEGTGHCVPLMNNLLTVRLLGISAL